jgi:hypothetical protein
MTDTTNAGPEPMFTATLYGSAELAQQAHIAWLRERIAELEDRLTTIHGAYSHAELLKQNAEDELDLLRADNESLRGLAKWASGRLLDAGDHKSAQTVLDKIPDRTAPAPQPDEIDRLRAKNEALKSRCQRAHDMVLSGRYFTDDELLDVLDFWSAPGRRGAAARAAREEG